MVSTSGPHGPERVRFVSDSAELELSDERENQVRYRTLPPRDASSTT